MSDRSVAEELHHIRKKVDQHDELLLRMVELQERQVAQGDRLNEYMERTDKRLDRMDDKVDTVKDDNRASIARAHERIDENKATILKWSGGIVAVVGLVSLFATIWRTWGS